MNGWLLMSLSSMGLLRIVGRTVVYSVLQDGFSERDIYKHEWSGLKNAEIVSHACQELEMDSWIRRRPHEGGRGRPASPCYDINPALKIK